MEVYELANKKAKEAIVFLNRGLAYELKLEHIIIEIEYSEVTDRLYYMVKHLENNHYYNINFWLMDLQDEFGWEEECSIASLLQMLIKEYNKPLGEINKNVN